jgi:hypothetical protein
MTNAVNIAQSGSNNVTFRNRIINGACVIDQRNAGASVTPANGTYTLDRWKCYQTTASKFSVQQNAGSVTPPAGFTNYLGITSLSAYSVSASDYYTLQQPIEAFNAADLAWGTANAKTVTLSFWVRSSLTGTFGGSIFNAAGDRSYPFTYTVSSANTWTTISVTIAGDTSGSWGTTTGISLQICFSLGAGSTYSGTAGAWASTLYTSATGATSVVGTNGATFYITGVQLEAGTTASPFEYRLYGTELALCQRYYEKSFPIGTAPADNISTATGNTTQFIVTSYASTNYVSQNINFQVSKRAAPTMTYYANSAIVGTNGTAGQWRSYVGGAWVNATSTTSNQNTNTGFIVAGGGLTGATTGQSYFSTGEWVASAEL